MKNHHIANVILVIVLIIALGGLYYLFKGPGRAIELPTTDRLGFCCCTSGDTFKVASTKLSSELFPTDCAITCQEHKAESLGQC